MVPRFLSWQLAHLRAPWQGEDYPNTPPANLPPIIDPDLLIPSDFRNQVATDAAYNLYTTRATTVLGWFNTLKQQRQALRQQLDKTGKRALRQAKRGQPGKLAKKRALKRLVRKLGKHKK